MRATPVRIFLVMIILALIHPSSLMAERLQPPPKIQRETPTPPEILKTDAGPRESAEVVPDLIAAPERRTALVIGNGTYETGPLRNPANDATDMAAVLRRLGFEVILKKNAEQQEMEEAIEEFGNRLKRGGVGLFYFAGHGVQVSGVNYLIPVGARINKESDVKYRAVDANKILDEMAAANNGLNIVMLDACRDNPFARSFRNASRGLAIVSNAPTGTFISYSTGPGQVARDGDGRNSPYTQALLQYMNESGSPITDVFMKVRQRLQKETGQVPWELSSLVGKFYFRPGSAANVPSRTAPPMVDDGAEQRRIEAERELLRQKAALEEQKRKMEELEKRLAAVQRSSHAGNKTGGDERFIANSDGTVLDTKTNLMWAARDNGNNINWQDAKSYCENFRGGSYTDWRLPTKEELAGLFDPAITNTNPPTWGCSGNYHLTNRISLTCCCAWAYEIIGSDVAPTHINFGGRTWLHQYRALPVRSTK
jgi:uncharacterized caspase-like protein